MEQVKWEESLILNLNPSAKVAILSTRSSETDTPLSDNDIASLLSVFGKNVVYVEAHFEATNKGSKVSRVTIKYMDGKEEKDNPHPTVEQIKKIVELRNKLFKGDNTLLQIRNGASEAEGMSGAIISGTITDPKTGKQRPMTKEELQKFLEYFGGLFGGNEDNYFTISNDIFDDIFKELDKSLDDLFKRKRRV